MASTYRNGNTRKQFGVRPPNKPRYTRGGVNYAQSSRTRSNFRRFGRPSDYQNQRFGNRPMEVNRNEGGWKNINQGLVYIVRSCDNVHQFYIKPVSQGSYYCFWDGSNFIDLKTELLNNDEFTTYRLLCTKYKFIGVRISVNYSCLLPTNSVLGKLVLTPETDLIQITDPIINTNSMKLDMSRPGVKNFNFNLTKANTLEDHVDWYPSTQDWDGTLKVKISNQGDNKNGNNDQTLIGSFKVSLIVKFAIQDVGTSVMKLLQKVPDLKTKLLSKNSNHGDFNDIKFLEIKDKIKNTEKVLESGLKEIDESEDKKDETLVESEKVSENDF
jgi:hypothetical protein